MFDQLVVDIDLRVDSHGNDLDITNSISCGPFY